MYLLAVVIACLVTIFTWLQPKQAVKADLNNPPVVVAPEQPTPQKIQAWWNDAVIYQIYVRSFMDSNGDGTGDLKGIESKLDYLKDLGVDAIWLSPIHPSPNADFGYDVADYEGIQPQFGTMNDFHDLMNASKQRGIRIILDLVVNHTSDEHPWFMESRSSLDNPKRDWYLWHPGRNGAEPNNWQMRLCGGVSNAVTNGCSSWKKDTLTHEYYLHSFFEKQPDLNWRNPEVRAEVKRIMAYWLDMGVSGFRLDVANYFLKDETLRDNPPEESYMKYYVDSWFYPYHNQVHEHDKDLPEVIDIFRELREVADGYNAVLLGEIDSEPSDPAVLKAYGENNDGLHTAFYFGLMNGEIKSVPTFYKQLGPRHPLITLGNHDTSRLLSRVGGNEALAKLHTMLELTLKGTPVIYNGEELGMADAVIETAYIVDPAGLAMKPYYMGRDGCRSPLDWSNDSMLAFYQAIIHLRRSWLSLGDDKQAFFHTSNRDLVFFTRTFSEQTITVVLNFGSESAFTGLMTNENRIVFSSSKGPQDTWIGDTITLGPLSGVVLQTR